MNIYDDNPEVLMPPTPKLNRCRCCGKERVFRPGDYCRDCALLPNELAASEAYIIVEPHTIADTAAKTGVALAFLRAKMNQAEMMSCQYVIFRHPSLKDDWQDVIIDQYFYLPRVMQTVFERLEDE